MATSTIKWNEGDGYIVATYEGSGDGPITLTTDTPNEGIDREQEITIQTTDKNKSVNVLVKQEGLREVFMASDGDFILADGGTYNVLKEVSHYTKIEYLEGTGSQYMPLGIVFKNTDECYAEVAMLTSEKDKFFISPSKWNHLSQNRFALGGVYNDKFTIGYGGASTGTTLFIPNVSYNANKHSFAYKEKRFIFDDGVAIRDVASVQWNGDTTELLLFYGYNAPTSCRIYCYKQKRDGELIIDLIPVLDENNVACMYDKVSNNYFYGVGEFIAGNKK